VYFGGLQSRLPGLSFFRFIRFSVTGNSDVRIQALHAVDDHLAVFRIEFYSRAVASESVAGDHGGPGSEEQVEDRFAPAGGVHDASRDEFHGLHGRMEVVHFRSVYLPYRRKGYVIPDVVMDSFLSAVFVLLLPSVHHRHVVVRESIEDWLVYGLVVRVREVLVVLLPNDEVPPFESGF
jgi:hypothetical protein